MLKFKLDENLPIEVTLRPAVAFSGDLRPGSDELAALHHELHEKCFIANSVKTEVRCEPVQS